MTGDERLQILIDAGFTPEEIKRVVSLFGVSRTPTGEPVPAVSMNQEKSEALGRYLLAGAEDSND